MDELLEILEVEEDNYENQGTRRSKSGLKDFELDEVGE